LKAIIFFWLQSSELPYFLPRKSLSPRLSPPSPISASALSEGLVVNSCRCRRSFADVPHITTRVADEAGRVPCGAMRRHPDIIR